ncbi:FitA-like ribbon-helix-helix domain-containing protein [Neisseria blantyrii]|uniref:FitA-like ribbon-helix-helix domain-containing protein n=1 Tax=Neisseria blantyrii TaxID=2830647 RepID=UPI00265ADBB8|nr:antitoxin [Neisseria blantyrii]
MASVVIRNLSETTHKAIKFRARSAGRSTEAEIRLILDNIAKAQQTVRLGSILASIGQEIGGVELEDVRERNTENEVSL